MNQLAKISALAALSNAQLTLTTKDSNGNIIDQSTGAFTAGEKGMATVDLSIAKDSLATIELNIATYGPEKCAFFMNKAGKKSKMAKVGGFKEACAWPGKYFDKSSFTGKLNVLDMPQFKTDAELTVMCETQDVTLSKASKNWACESTELDTIAANTLEYPAFNFSPFYESKKLVTASAAGVGMVAVHKFFLQGANPALDFAYAGLDYLVYWAGASQFNASNGKEFEQKTILKQGKQGGRSLAKEEEIASFLKWGSEVNGYSNYRTRILISAIDLFSYYYNSEETTLRGKLDDVQDAVFSWNEDTWTFKQLIEGNLAYKDDWYMDVRTYFYLYSFILQTTGVVMEAQGKSQWLPVDLVRDLAYTWELVMSGFLEIQ